MQTKKVCRSSYLQEVEQRLREADGVGGDRDGVGEEEHEADGAAQRGAQRARYHVVHAAGRDLKTPGELRVKRK